MARGYLLAFANPRTMDGSVQAFERSIVLDPKNAEAHHQYGSILNWISRDAEADPQQHEGLAFSQGRAIRFVDIAWRPRRDTKPSGFADAIALAPCATSDFLA